jgi:hypothetical protein
MHLLTTASSFHFFAKCNVPSHGPSIIVSRTSLSRDCKAIFMPTASCPPKAPAVLSPLVSAYVEATNRLDLEGLLATFADDALVNDQLRDYWGKPAIREWALRDIIGQSLAMDVTNVIEHYGNFIVTANVVGKFDMTGLPDPLVYAFYFTPHGDRIVQLIILRNRYDVENGRSHFRGCLSPCTGLPPSPCCSVIPEDGIAVNANLKSKSKP